jgi:hypothetical protein
MPAAIFASEKTAPPRHLHRASKKIAALAGSIIAIYTLRLESSNKRVTKMAQTVAVLAAEI